MYTIDDMYQFVQRGEAVPKAMIQFVEKLPNLKEILKEFLDRKKFRDDDWILYNWWIGTNFRISINELRAK